MRTLFLVWLCATLPSDGLLRDHVDIIEVNHFYNSSTGEHVFDQVIFWNWRAEDESRLEVVAWRMMRHVRGCVRDDELRAWQTDPLRHPPPEPRWLGGHATPWYDPVRQRFVSSWFDESDQALREVTAPVVRHTWTWHDPELADRKVLPQERRAGLKRRSAPR